MDSNILDTLTLNQAMKLAKKNLGSGFSDEAKSIYKDILARFPQNKKAIDGIKAIPDGPNGAWLRIQDPSIDQLQPLVSLYRRGELQRVLDQVAEMLKQFPNSCALHNICGVTHGELKQFDSAIESYKQALKIKPDFANAYYNMGAALKEKGKVDPAIESYKQALKIKPDFADAYYNMGIALQDKGEVELAIESYRQVLKIKPDFADAYNNMGNVLEEKGEADAAIDSFRQALKINPDFAEAYHGMGIALKGKGELAAALGSFSEALRINPDYAEAYNSVGIVLQEKGELDAALGSFGLALKIKPYYAEAYINMGVAQYSKGDLNAAIESYKQVLKIKPDFAEAYSNMGKALKGVVFSKPMPGLKEIITSLLSRKNYVRPSYISKAGISLLRFEPVIKELFAKHSAGELKRSLQVTILELSEVPLLLKLMSVCPLADLELEAVLTYIRSTLLSYISVISNSPELLRFQSALALQCFTNEYIYNQTDKEAGALKELEFSIEEAFSSGEQPSPHSILCLASYKALHNFEWAGLLVVTTSFEEVFTRQYLEPREENRIKFDIPILEEITDKVSSKVRGQYEENPFPRWVNLGISLRPIAISKIVNKSKLRLFDTKIVNVEAPNILIAGCGTGQHSIGTATTFRNSRVLAIDLSLASLAYAKRKTKELGFQNIDYMQADILDLGKLDKQFDIVESSGVLHHMDDPMSGWRVLTDCLKCGGLMRIGLYSELARQHIVTLREEISQSGIGSSDVAMKSFRSGVINSDKEHHKWILKVGDFYSISMLRDLLFHVQEHRFTLPQIQDCLSQLGLEFCGFEADKILRDFKLVNNGLNDSYSLDKWSLYEEANPHTFLGMYQFWCQKVA